jgi:hypothetical protein
VGPEKESRFFKPFQIGADGNPGNVEQGAQGGNINLLPVVDHLFYFLYPFGFKHDSLFIRAEGVHAPPRGGYKALNPTHSRAAARPPFKNIIPSFKAGLLISL